MAFSFEDHGTRVHESLFPNESPGILYFKNFDGLHGKMADEIFLHASGLHDEK